MNARKRSRAYILILPSMFTTGNLFFGFYSILRSFNHDFERAAYAILFAALFDVLDGRVARITRSSSDFGIQYDSICDVVSFGLAPAVLSYVWGLSHFGRLGWAGAFFFAACGALRLARFNTIALEEQPKSYFLGLPIPAAANTIAALVIFAREIGLENPGVLLLVLSFALGLLMVSNVRYRAFKDFDVRHRRSFFHLVLLVLAVAFLAVKHEVGLFVIAAVYVTWAPIREGLALFRKQAPEKSHIDSHTGPKNLL